MEQNISNGCTFIENTKKNIYDLIKEYECKDFIVELLNSPILLNTSGVTNMRRMFHGCSSLVSITLDTSMATDMDMIFKGCSSLVK